MKISLKENQGTVNANAEWGGAGIWQAQWRRICKSMQVRRAQPSWDRSKWAVSLIEPSRELFQFKNIKWWTIVFWGATEYKLI